MGDRPDPERWEPPVTFGSDQLCDVRAAHPLAECVPLLRRTLLDAADGTTHIMIVTDADGNILRREGHRDVCRDADRVWLAEGTRWAESSIGTNAMGNAEFQIDLRNDVLSGLSIKISARNGKISATFSGSDREVLKLLEQQSEGLKTALGSRGLKLEGLRFEAKS